MRATYIAISALMFTTTASGQQVQNVSQLLGKKVVVQRVLLCEPGTYNSVSGYAGRQATVLSVKASKTPALPPSALASMTPETRALLEDQQKAATVLVQFDDGKKLDTCLAIGPARITYYFQLAEGETLTEVPAQPNTAAASPSIGSQTQAAEMLTNDEVKSALAGAGKNRFVRIDDAGLMAAQGASVPHIILFMPEAVIAARSEEARKQFLPYEPSEEDRKRSLMVYAQGYVGNTYQEGCMSITRVVLISAPLGGVVKEAYLSESGTDAWANGYGATNHCAWLRAKFSIATVREVQAAAQDGEFYIAVFSGTQNTKTYKIKHKHQSKLELK
jgi:hypothetical protein